MLRAPYAATLLVKIWGQIYDSQGARCRALRDQRLLPRGFSGYRRGRSNKNRIAPMNSPQELNHEDVLRVKLEVLRQKHRDLDEAINALQEKGPSAQLTIQRLKKDKLQLKDQIARIEDELTPDIIA